MLGIVAALAAVGAIVYLWLYLLFGRRPSLLCLLGLHTWHDFQIEEFQTVESVDQRCGLCCKWRQMVRHRATGKHLFVEQPSDAPE